MYEYMKYKYINMYIYMYVYICIYMYVYIRYVMSVRRNGSVSQPTRGYTYMYMLFKHIYLNERNVKVFICMTV
jgi:hypothetical protein